MTEQQLPTYRAHDGWEYFRPPGATEEHVPVWHRFLDVPTGQTAEHISHWIIDPGATGYLSQTEPISPTGQDIGHEQARCFGCGTPVVLVQGTYYRRDGRVILVRCQDDPEWDHPNVSPTEAEGMR